MSAAASEDSMIVSAGGQRIARVYAEALLDAAERKGQADSVIEELDSMVQDILTARPDFELFLNSHSISRKRKAPVIRAAFESRASELFLNFLLVLNDRDRLELLRAILINIKNLRDERARRIHVKVRTAVPLADDQRQRLVNDLRESFQLEPILDTTIDPDLLGGIVVRVGDWLYDASVKTHLDHIRHNLIERSSHEIQSSRDRFSTANGA